LDVYDRGRGASGTSKLGGFFSSECSKIMPRLCRFSRGRMLKNANSSENPGTLVVPRVLCTKLRSSIIPILTRERATAPTSPPVPPLDTQGQNQKARCFANHPCFEETKIPIPTRTRILEYAIDPDSLAAPAAGARRVAWMREVHSFVWQGDGLLDWLPMAGSLPARVM
jgi:hypothetical protein